VLLGPPLASNKRVTILLAKRLVKSAAVHREVDLVLLLVDGK